MVSLQIVRGLAFACAAAAVGAGPAAAGPGHGPGPSGKHGSFLASLGTPALVASTIPPNGDVNPYGVAVVPNSAGDLVRDDVLVSNFNASSNLQGTGSTIVQVDPKAHTASVFAQIKASEVPGCTGGVGLTTALAVFKQGWVVVGSLPVSYDPSGNANPMAGCLIVLDSHGTPVETITGPTVNGSPLINGPWDMTAVDDGDHATLFVTNVLDNIGSATMTSPVPGGTVVRVQLDLSSHGTPSVTDIRVIADGIDVRPDSAALVVGPTGVGLEGDTLYVADSVNSQILAVHEALRRNDATIGQVVSSGGNLNDPLGLAIAPNGNIVTVNGGDGNAVETTPHGDQIATDTLDNNSGGGGNLFGIALAPHDGGLYFVDDFSSDNNLMVTQRTGPGNDR
jgi:sugar lactone lactonase YvrE